MYIKGHVLTLIWRLIVQYASIFYLCPLAAFSRGFLSPIPVRLVYSLWDWRKPGAADTTTDHQVSTVGGFRCVNDITFCWTCLVPGIDRGRNER